ncbi:MAG: DNA polymerase III subunit [Candidatus Eisenbacteria bacterium]
MGFRDIINQEQAKEFLKSSIRSDRVGNGYLFHGPRGVGKASTALAFAQALNCEKEDLEACGECSSCRRIARFMYPDVTFLFPTTSTNEYEEIVSTLKGRSEEVVFVHSFSQSASIKIKAIQDLRMTLAMGVREGRRRVIILAHTERMKPEASNCLLRMLEEPTAGVTFVLTVTSRHILLPTILSRCQAVRFVPLPSADVERVLVEKKLASAGEARILAKLSGGSLVAALEFAGQGIVKYRHDTLEYLRRIGSREPSEALRAAEKLASAGDRNQVRIFVHLALLWMRDLFLLKCGVVNGEIANADMIDDLKREASLVDLGELRRRVDILEEAVSSMEHNVDLSLGLASSFLRLEGFAKEASNPLDLQRHSSEF